MKITRVTIISAICLLASPLIFSAELSGASKIRSYTAPSSHYTHYGSPYGSGISCSSRYDFQPNRYTNYSGYHQPGHYSPYSRRYFYPNYNGFHITGPIPGIVDNIRRPKPPVLAKPTGYLTREYFLIDTLNRDSEQDQELAAIELAQHQTLASVAALSDALINGTNATIRIAAAKSLSQINTPEIYRPLLRASRIEYNPKVLAEINIIVGAINEASPIKLTIAEPKNLATPHGSHKLARYIENLRLGRSEIRRDAVKEMANYKDSRSVAALISSLINDKDSGVRKASAESLRQIADPLALEFLKAAVENDIDEAVQKHASIAIKAIKK